MTETKYLTQRIAEMRYTNRPAWGLTVNGYTRRGGAPTPIMVRLDGERRWRRLMLWLFSNAGTTFIRIKGEEFVVTDSMLPVDGA